MSVILEAQNLTLAWHEDDFIVDGLSLEVREGELVCLVGKSGMGKTTILHALAGLLAPRAGQVLLRGADITGKPGHISYMLQKDLLLPNLRVVDNAALPLVLAGTAKSEARDQALALLDHLGLASVADAWPAQLSGGMRQRVAFARTYLQGNSVVLLDEPFSALDAITRTSLRTWFKRMVAELGLSTLMITHDPDEATLLADRIYVLGKSEVHGVYSRIAGEIIPQHPSETTSEDYTRSNGIPVHDYSLTPEFLEAKSAILALL